MMRRVKQADILNRERRRIVRPDGTLADGYLSPELFGFLDVVSRDIGVVVERHTVAASLWPKADDEIATGAALNKRAQRVRAALMEAGWTRETLATVEWTGWEIDPDEVARVMAEARGE